MKQDLILERVEFGKENNKHFFILSVFDPKACRYLTTALQCYLMNEQEKKGRKEYTARKFFKSNMVRQFIQFVEVWEGHVRRFT